AVLVVLPAIDLLFVGGGGDLDPLHLAVRTGVGPGIGAAVLLAREADLRQSPLLVVVFPAIELAVLVEIAPRSNGTGTVHVGPGVDLAVLVTVVGELGELAGGLVVSGPGGLLDPLLFGIRAAGQADGDRGEDEGSAHVCASQRITRGRPARARNGLTHR